MRPEERAELKQENMRKKKERLESLKNKEDVKKDVREEAKEEIKESVEKINKDSDVRTEVTDKKPPFDINEEELAIKDEEFETMTNEEAQDLVDKGEAEIPEEAIVKEDEEEYPFKTDKKEVTKEIVEEKVEKAKAQAIVNQTEEDYKPFFAQLKGDCTKPGGAYYPHVRFLLAEADVKTLWERDEAYLLDSPELARIDNTKPFILSNCEFKEEENGGRKLL